MTNAFLDIIQNYLSVTIMSKAYQQIYNYIAQNKWQLYSHLLRIQK
jgi:hypothetical protein